MPHVGMTLVDDSFHEGGLTPCNQKRAVSADRDAFLEPRGDHEQSAVVVCRASAPRSAVLVFLGVAARGTSRPIDAGNTAASAAPADFSHPLSFGSLASAPVFRSHPLSPHTVVRGFI
jgi:hypothetical protein